MAGLADDPSYSVSGWFRLHWLPLMNELWLDSREDWIDGGSRPHTLHLLDVHGLDRGRLATARVLPPSARP